MDSNLSIACYNIRFSTLFENDMHKMTKKFNFCKIRNEFKRRLNESIKIINSPNLFTSRKKKTTSTYEFKPNDYNKMLKENMTTVYKKMDINAIKSIDKET